MIYKKPFLFLCLKFALVVVTAFLNQQTASAQEENLLSVGKIQFGKQTDDKWLKVDLKKTTGSALTNRSITAGPKVVTNSSIYSARPSYTTIYARNTSALAISTTPLIYPAATTMVSNHKLLQAAGIAVSNARGHSTGSCWRYVKSALLKADAIDTYPKTGYAKQAASELVQDYGFVRTAISNPFSAPVGSVLVYGGAGAGHVEFRTRNGFVSDFVSAKPSNRPLLGVFVKR